MLQDDKNDPLAFLAKNVHRVKKIELDWSDSTVSKEARIIGRKVSPKTVNNVENRRHGKAIENVAAIAQAMRVPVWQLFLERFPESQSVRRELEKIAEGFVMLAPPEREILLKTMKKQDVSTPLRLSRSAGAMANE